GTDSSATADVHRQIERRMAALQSRLHRLDAGDELDRVWSGLRELIERVTEEHAGMAEELLALYEQLGVIFDVTRRLEDVRDEDDVVRLLTDSLRRSFMGCRVFSVKTAEGVETPARRGSTWWLPFLVQARTRRGVLVESAPPDAEGDPREVMIAPLFAGEAFVCWVVLARDEEAAAFRACDMLLLESLSQFCGDVIRNYRLVNELRRMSLSMVRTLVSAVDQKDPYTSGHSVRVGFFATMLARDLGLDESAVQMLQWSALLHDVGKIGIRDDVLKKQGKLTETEMDHMREHPSRSYHVVREVPELREALDGVLHHHEHYDGSGYPSGLKGEAIPLQARIIQIADVFDALTSDRAYRSAYSWEQALEVLRAEAGRTVDPKLQQRFDRLIRERLADDPEGWRILLDEANRFLADHRDEVEKEH
ncbi:MAG: HD-GYP domain-containing protein, partial [Planctomycetota bacterium]